MIRINKQTIVNAPIEQVWASWDRFGDIKAFNPNLRASSLLSGSVATGVGAKRRCDLSDGKTSIFEEIVDYAPQEHMTVVLFDGNVPIKRGTIRIDLESVSSNQTRLLVNAEFQMKFGVLGKLMGVFAKSQLASSFDRLLEGNAQYVEAKAA